MGYHTDFAGDFTITPALEENHRKYLVQFNETRRMRRDPLKALELPDPIREAVGLPIGSEGAFFVGGGGFMGQDDDASVLDHNEAPGQESYNRSFEGESWRQYWDKKREQIAAGECQPGLWCQWVPNEDGTKLEWDGGEKFYEYVPWLKYLITNFLDPWGYKLNGEVSWSGEEQGDVGVIHVEDNVVTTGQRIDDRDFDYDD